MRNIRRGQFARGCKIMTIGTATWLPISASDIVVVDAIATAIHPGLPESPEVFSEKVHLFPSGCFKYVKNNNVMGYGISHPWLLFQIPPLDELLGGIPTNADCMYIHDVAILPAARGNNAAGKYVDKIREVAKLNNLEKIACVSVYGTDVLWGRFGFKIVQSDGINNKLLTYGNSAKYMIANV